MPAISKRKKKILFDKKKTKTRSLRSLLSSLFFLIGILFTTTVLHPKKTRKKMMYRAALSFCSTNSAVRRVSPRGTLWLVANKATTTSKSSWRAAFSSFSTPDPPTSNHLHTPLSNAQGSILYTETDEAPALATFCLYPILRKVRQRAFLSSCVRVCVKLCLTDWNYILLFMYVCMHYVCMYVCV